MKKYLNKLGLIGLLLYGSLACTGFLDERPNKGILIPTTVEDVRALLDNDAELNLVPSIGLLSSDDLLISDDGYTSLGAIVEQNAYLWKADVFEGGSSADWDRSYRSIFIANVALEQLEKLPESDLASSLKGEALFHRAHAHFMVAQIFAEVYEDQSIASALPIRLDTEILARTPRASMDEYYAQILNDLNQAFEVLPEFDPIKTRPSKLAAKTLLARVYLSMEDYDSADKAASWVLSRQESSLMDYSSLNAAATYPFPQYNSEVIFYATLISQSYLSTGNVNVWIHPEIYDTYAEGDLRKELYGLERPNGGVSFMGNYSGNFARFGGLALDELYLIQAECLARKGEDIEALTVLNSLLKSRFEPGMFEDIQEVSGDSLLELILEEKRKSLVFRGINWIDLRRLNRGNSLQRTVSRTVNGITYQLEPGSNRYIYPIPQNELNFNPIQQNDRN